MGAAAALARQPTTEQSAGADPGVSSWVVASAGTGKTQVLTDRVLRLLLAGAQPGAILCLTFTRAAAAEMMTRVTGVLARWATAPGDDLAEALRVLAGGGAPVGAEQIAAARRLFATVLDVPGGFRIQTIHAFCNSLLARFPVESGVPSHFQVMDERTAAEMLNSARDRVLQRMRGDGAFAERVSAATQVNERQFDELMLSLTNQRARLRPVLADGPEAATARLRAHLGLAAGETRERIRAAACTDGEFDERNLLRVARAMAAGGKKDALHGAHIEAWVRAEAEGRVRRFEQYRAAFFTKEGEPRKPLIHKDALKTAPDGAEVLEREAVRLERLRSRMNAATIFENTRALLVFADALFEEYHATKARYALLDYEDLILCTRDLLNRPGIGEWVLFKLDGGVDHILIDEAQDTSPEQWDVIDAIAHEFFAGAGARDARRTVFAVGDAKQSIYLFRGADPDAFARWRYAFGVRVADADALWRPVDLTRSFRSAKPVLDAVDAIFAGAAAQKGLLLADAEVRHIVERRGQGGSVELWAAEQPAEAVTPSAWEPALEQEHRRSASARLAGRIAGTLRGWLDAGEMLPARDRPVRPGDVMILVQRRSAFVEEMIRALKDRGIDVAGVDRMIITEQLPVQDLLAAARFVLLPEDDLNLAAVLKGPFVGLGEEALFDLCHGRTRRLWGELRARAGERQDFAAAVAVLKPLLERAGFVPPHAFFAGLLAKGGRRQVLARLGHEAQDPVDEFLARALEFERSHPPSLQEFVHWIEQGAIEVQRDLEVGRNEVRVMTIHGAKGLQAPVVFLPDTVRVSAFDDPLLWDRTADPPLPLWPQRKEFDDEAAAKARGAARGLRDEEYNRLLYVAMTRAEDRLIVCGWDTKNKRRPNCWYKLIEEGLANMPGTPEELEGGVRRWSQAQDAELDAPGEGAALPERAPPLPEWVRRAPAAEKKPPMPLSPSRPSGDEPPAFSPLGHGPGAGLRRGVLIHRMLQLLPEVEPEKRADGARRFLAANAAEFAAEERDEMAAAALRVLEAPEFAPLFGPGSRAEVPVAGVIGDVVVSGQIDRLVVTEREVLIVDYKTHRPAPATEADVPDVYRRQMAAYAAAVAAVYPGRAVRCALLWTDGPRWVALSAAGAGAP